MLRLTVDGATRQRVCKACAGLAVPVLATERPNVCECCGKGLARVCVACVARTVQNVEDGRGYSRPKLPAAPRAAPEEWGADGAQVMQDEARAEGARMARECTVCGVEGCGPLCPWTGSPARNGF